MDGFTGETRKAGSKANVNSTFEFPWTTLIDEDKISNAKLLLYHYRNQDMETYMRKRTGLRQMSGGSRNESGGKILDQFRSFEEIMNVVNDTRMRSRTKGCKKIDH